jgi:hypothetical protein
VPRSAASAVCSCAAFGVRIAVMEKIMASVNTTTTASAAPTCTANELI